MVFWLKLDFGLKMHNMRIVEHDTDHSSSLGAADSRNFHVEHIFYMNPSDYGRVLQLSGNGINMRKPLDSCQIPGSCVHCVHGHTAVTNMGVDGCSSSAASCCGHKSLTCKSNCSRFSERACEGRTIVSTGIEDHCTCSNIGGISRSNSVSSLGSMMNFNDENADEVQTLNTIQESDHDKESQLSQSYATRVEELQLDLLECALEYEVKILEMKMKMVQMRSHSDDSVQSVKTDQNVTPPCIEQPELPVVSGQLEKMLAQRLDNCRKKMNRLQVHRDSLAKELLDFRKKQRKFETQRRNMDDLLRRVNNLQRKLIKKEEAMVECQLKEKEAKARLHELQVALQRSRAKNYEPEQLVKLIPSLRTWLRSLKKSAPIKGNHKQLLQVEQFDAVLGRILENAPREMFIKQGHVGTLKSSSRCQSPRGEHSTPVDCIKEVYELQKELQRLAVYR